VASLFFYAWWNIVYLPLILISVVFNYFFARVIIAKKGLLSFGIIVNLALLAYFKYVDFFIENFNYMSNNELPLLQLALPLAISFYTFQQIAYLVDSYRGETAEYDFLNYAVFVTFFPQLIAGPIVHHSEMMPQFLKLKNKVLQYHTIAAGIFIFTIGLFKKVVIADSFAVWATQGFDMERSLTMLEGWMTSLSYTFQLYFDFSGYTDMAIGAALLFNIKLPVNFDSPYKATNIQDFWRRWHITLSRFLKEYIYIPLGGNRKSDIRTYTNVFITFLLGGIWHGAGWTFVVWGALHGLALVLHRAWKKLGLHMPTFFAWLVTFSFINIAWIFFRATSFESAIKVLQAMFTFDGDIFSKSKQFPHMLHYVHPLSNYVSINMVNYMFILLLLGFILSLCAKNSHELKDKFMTMKQLPLTWTIGIGLLLGVSLIVIASNPSSEFLYFNF
jgi:D-alanyl-lipoteichoic acid acyltransferase DltB (MBOAT superfamily)